jgi:hypothetical protein
MIGKCWPVDNFSRGLTESTAARDKPDLLHSGDGCHRGRLSRSDPAPRIRHARKHRSGGPPSSEHHRITSSRLVRFVDRPHGRAQNRDSFGAAARFTTQPSPTMAYPPRATTEDLERIPRTVSPSFALPERISPTVNGCGAIRSTVLNVVCGKVVCGKLHSS